MLSYTSETSVYAIRTGAGDIDSAVSFTCVAPSAGNAAVSKANVKTNAGGR